MSQMCHCGSKKKFEECCLPLLDGEKAPLTAEELLRSRYCAFVVGRMEYILETLHPDQRKEYDEKGARDWSLNSEWLGLEILSTQAGKKKDEEGTVDFVARYRQKGIPQEHREHAEFKKVEGRWYFWDASIIKPETVRREQPKIGRNDPCTCGSGKKYKKCCGAA